MADIATAQQVAIEATQNRKFSVQAGGDWQLRTRGMVVMAIDRAGVVIPAPHAETMLSPGDRLICYGKVKTIGGIADEKPADVVTVAEARP